jgi:glycosyltransferase involved in cell wall biosynthesis
LKVFVVDPPLFTLPYDVHFARALAAAGASVDLIGRPLRGYERMQDEQFRFRPLFYRLTEPGKGWQTSRAAKLLKAVEHGAGLWSLQRQVAAERPDAVHVQWLVLPTLERQLLRRIRRQAGLFLTVHNASLAAHSADSVVGGVGAAAQRFGRRDILDEFDGFIAHTEQTRAHLERAGIAPERICVLGHPPLTPGELPAVRADGTVRILFFGSIKPYKGIDVLVRAALQLLPSRPNCRIDVVGRPFSPLDSEMEAVRQAGLSDRFGFDLRFIPDEDLARYLAAADITVFPYREIDASGAFALAVAAGKPVVASALGVFAEQPAASAISLFPAGDADALASALAPLVDDAGERRAAAEKVRALGGTLDSWPDFAKGCIAFYDQRLAERRAEGSL